MLFQNIGMVVDNQSIDAGSNLLHLNFIQHCPYLVKTAEVRKRTKYQTLQTLHCKKYNTTTKLNSSTCPSIIYFDCKHCWALESINFCVESSFFTQITISFIRKNKTLQLTLTLSLILIYVYPICQKNSPT